MAEERIPRGEHLDAFSVVTVPLNVLWSAVWRGGGRTDTRYISSLRLPSQEVENDRYYRAHNEAGDYREIKREAPFAPQYIAGEFWELAEF